MNVAEKAAYIKGLMDGMKLDTESDTGKVLKAVVDLLEDLSLSVLDLEDEAAYLNDYIEEVDEDLGDIERTVWDLDDEDCCCDDCDSDCGDCDCCDSCEFDEFDCPVCGEKVFIDDDMEGDTVICPSCNTEIEFCFEEDDEDGCEDGCCCCDDE